MINKPGEVKSLPAVYQSGEVVKKDHFDAMLIGAILICAVVLLIRRI